MIRRHTAAKARAALTSFLLGTALLIPALPAAHAESGAAKPVDLIILNGQVRTMEPGQADATALAIDDGVIIRIGSPEAVRALAGPATKVIDANGRTVLPGFIDTHIHPRPQFDEMAPHGLLDLTPEGGVTSRADLFAKLRRKAAVTPRGRLIAGRGYYDNLIGGHPTAAELDAVIPDHPVILRHSSGHRSVVNSLALNGANITDATPDPAGGKIERDAAGKATGIMLEASPGFAALYDAQPEPSEQEVLDAYRREFRALLSYGLVGVGDANASPEKLAIYRTLLKGGLPVRVYAMTSYRHLDWLVANRFKSEWQVPGLTLDAIKLFHGNSLSGRTAWLYEPYAHDPHYFGIAPKLSQDELNAVVARIHNAGLQAAIHTNGDREIDMVLTAIDAAQRANPRPDPRHRLEHASVVNSQILARMKALQVAVAPHSYVLNHGEKMEDFGAGRWNMMHPNRSALDLGIPVGGNSDSPVSPPKVMERIQSMATRRARGNGKVYGADQRVTVDQALSIWTRGSAYLQFEEKSRGTLAVGKRADIVILSADPAKIDPDHIEDVAVDYTIVSGAVCYARKPDGGADYCW